MSNNEKLTVEQIAAMMEEEEDILEATIFIESPKNALLSEGDSDEEDPTGDIDKLSGNQLRGGAELVCKKITDDGILQFRIAENETYCRPSENSTVNDNLPTSPILNDDVMDFLCIENKNDGLDNLCDLDIPTSQTSTTSNAHNNLENQSTCSEITKDSTIDKQNKNSGSSQERKKRKQNHEDHISGKKRIVNSKLVPVCKNVNSRPKLVSKNVHKNVNQSTNTKQNKINRNWEKHDIPNKSSIEFERPSFLSNEFSPVDAFEYFFDDDVCDYIVECTNQFAVEKGNLSFSMNRDELRLFFSILFLSGYNVLSRTRMYWETSDDVHNVDVAKAMSRNRFEDIMKYLHFCKNAELSKDDRIRKIRPVLSMLNERWLQYFPGDVYLSIDESMVPYYGRHGAKQHIHGKPIRFGYKVLVIATRLGYVIQCEPYQGKSIATKIPELGLGGSVVIDLISELPKDRHYSLFFDNFFTSFRLLEALRSKGFDGTGTVRADRVEGAPLLDIKSMKKQPRGSYSQLTDTNTGITLVRYNDNNVFTMASTAAGITPIGKAKRWSRTEKKHIVIDQPANIILYNTYMGGIDRMDENIASYRIDIRNKKWYWPMISYLLSVSMNNAWQVFRMSPRGIEENLDFLSFIRHVVRSYLAIYKNQSSFCRKTKYESV